MLKELVLKPRLSEKAYQLSSDDGNTYVFEIPRSANKHLVAKAVASQYAVGVKGVRIASVPGKVKRSYRRGGRNVFKGRNSDIRKAYVTLKAGDKLPIFAAVEEAKAKPEKEKK